MLFLFYSLSFASFLPMSSCLEIQMDNYMATISTWDKFSQLTE